MQTVIIPVQGEAVPGVAPAVPTNQVTISSGTPAYQVSQQTIPTGPAPMLVEVRRDFSVSAEVPMVVSAAPDLSR